MTIHIMRSLTARSGNAGSLIEKLRFTLRWEPDAAFFQLYGITRADAARILNTFPIVKRKDVKLMVLRRRSRAQQVLNNALTAAVSPSCLLRRHPAPELRQCTYL